nr:uncharacterized protein LOC128697019 isoform X1 [Cherax quadricarinatus]
MTRSLQPQLDISMFPSRGRGPSFGPFGFNGHRGGFGHHRGGHHWPFGPHHGSMRPHHHHHFGPQHRMCPLRDGGHMHNHRHHDRDLSDIIAATYHLTRHMCPAAHSFEDEFDEFIPRHADKHHHSVPTSAEDDAETSEHHMDEDQHQEQREQQQHTCNATSGELWASIGDDVWTAKVQLGPFTAAEVEVISDGKTGVEVRAAHRHGDMLVASMMRRLPPPCDAPYTVSHAHTPTSILVTARKVPSSSHANSRKDVSQPQSEEPVEI